MTKNNPRTKSNNQSILWIGALIILLIVAAIFISKPSALSNNPTLTSEVSVEKAYELREAGAFILDVRQPEEWEAAHIPESTLIPLGELSSRISEIPSGQTIVVVCRSGNRSAQGRDILLKAGIAPVTSMAGGINSWTLKGYPTVSGP